MNAQEFCYWLQGFFEITEASSNRSPDGLTEGQARMVREHLALVFKKVTPPASDTYSWPPVTSPGPVMTLPGTIYCQSTANDVPRQPALATC